MKNLGFVLLYLCIIFLGSCEDQIIETYTANIPVYITYEELRESVQAETTRNLEKPGKIYFYNNYLFINEYLDGIHIFDNTDPSSPQNLGFINIPGNVDIAVKDGILFADSFVDLVALDISDLNNIREINRINDIFPYILPPYNDNFRVDEIDYDKGIVVDWEIKKVTREIEQVNYPVFPWFESVDYMLSSYSNGRAGYSSGASSFGIGGSMARFTGKDNVLYTVDSYNLNVVDIQNVNTMFMTKSLSVGWNIETIFPSGNHLFIGSQNGMFIYDISNPYSPEYVSDYWHITSCDPVVVEGDYAYVTLRSGNLCGGETDQLDIIDITDLSAPEHVKSYEMEEPYGLGIDDNILFICDGSAGLKVYEVNASYNSNLDVHTVELDSIAGFPNIQAYDVIPVNEILVMIGDDGLYQYDYSDLENIELLSSITITQ